MTVLAVVLVLMVVLVLAAAALVQRGARRRLAARRDALPYWPAADWSAGLVTWQQAAALLPADLVDRIEHPDGYSLDTSGGRTITDHTAAGGRGIIRHLR